MYEKSRKVDNLIKCQQSNNSLRKEKEEILNERHTLEIKAEEFYKELKNLDLNCKLNSGSFHKIKKQITKQAEVKNGNLVTNKQLVIN